MRILKYSFFVIVSLTILIPIGTWAYLQATKTNEQKYFEQQINLLKKSGKKESPLRDLTNFSWDKICILPPYGGKATVSGYKLVGRTPISEDDGVWFLVFKDEKNKIAYSIGHEPFNKSLKMGFGKANGLQESSCYSTDKVILTLKPERDYYRLYLNSIEN